MKKITFVRAVQTQFGGAENFLSRLVEALKAQNIDIETLHSTAPKWLPSWLKARSFNRKCRKEKGNRFYFSLDRIDSADIYRAGDGVHKAYMQTRTLSSNPLHKTYCDLEKKCFENAKRIIVNSDKIRQEILEEYDVDPNKIRLVYNGINLPTTMDRTAARNQIDSEFPSAKNKPIILTAGSGFQRKGVKCFLKIISKIKTDFQAFVVGKEKDMEPYKALAKQLGVCDKVTFTGMRSDLDQFYQAADLFLFMPTYEPFGNVVLEALSYGTPTITSKHNGAHEILPAEYCFGDGSVELIDRLLTDQTVWQQASEQALEIAKQHPMTKTTEETLAVIKEVLDEH